MIKFTLLVLCFGIITISEAADHNNRFCLTIPRRTNSTVGKAGSKGEQGQKGEPGDIKSCGCKPGDIAELKEQVRALNESSSCAGLIYKNQCITIVGGKDSGVNYTEAKQVCSDLNATVAEITSDEMYNEVYEYVRKHMIQYSKSSGKSWHYSFVWLGSSFEPTESNNNNLITLRNGNKVELLNWYTGYPKHVIGSKYSTYVRLIFQVELYIGGKSRGIINSSPTLINSVPLCATKLGN